MFKIDKEYGEDPKSCKLRKKVEIDPVLPSFSHGKQFDKNFNFRPNMGVKFVL